MKVQRERLAHDASTARKAMPSHSMHCKLPLPQFLQYHRTDAHVDTASVISRLHGDRLLNNAYKWSRLRHVMHNLLCNHLFEVVLTVIILSQFALTIHETNLGAKDREVPTWMVTYGQICLCFYSMELVLRFYVYRVDFFNSKWHVLDLVVVGIDVVTTTLAAITDQNTSFFSILRMARFLKVAKAGRLLRFFPEVFIMVNCLAGAMRIIFWAGIVVGIALTLFSMLAVEFIHPLNVRIGTEDCKSAFESVFLSNLTFLQVIIAGDSFGTCTIPLMKAYPWTTVYFICALGTIGLGLVNMVLSAIVDRASQVRSENEHLLSVCKMHFYEEAKDSVEAVCRTLDKDSTGTLPLKTILDAYETNADFNKAFQTLGLGPPDITSVFCMMDEDRTGGIKHKEFAEHLLKMKTHDEQGMVIILKNCMNDLRHNIEQQFQVVKAEQAQIATLVQDFKVFRESSPMLSPINSATPPPGIPCSIMPLQIDTALTRLGPALSELAEANGADLNRLKMETQRLAKILQDTSHIVYNKGAELSSLGSSLTTALADSSAVTQHLQQNKTDANNCTKTCGGITDSTSAASRKQLSTNGEVPGRAAPPHHYNASCILQF